MNHIEEKLKQFLNNTLITDVTLNNTTLDKHNIRYNNTSYLIGTLFEKGSMNHVPNFQDVPNRIFIGAYSSIRDGGYMRSNIFIGRHSGLGRRCTVSAGMHNITGVSINSDTIMAKKSNYSDQELDLLNIRRDRTDVKEMNSKPVIIENDVFLGDNVIIMPGVTIGTGSVIAANSVVSRDIPPYVVAGGTPCIPIKDRFPSNVKEMLLKTHWWNAKLDILQTLPIDNVFKFVDSFNETYNSIGDTLWDTIPTLGYTT
jgi:acetyltransferase-like isoleucine patch superfamily enzyme